MRTQFVAAITLLLTLSVMPVFAQESRGTIGGRVLDPSSAVVAGAEVRVINPQTAATASARTSRRVA
jgi:hypothetical protein